MAAEYVDVHAHLDDPSFDEDREEVLKRAHDVLIINAGVDHETNLKTLTLAHTYGNVRACLGLHPEFVVRMSLDEAKRERDFVRERSNDLVGISEVGLDFKYTEKERQKEAFALFLSLAQELDLPVVVHSRRAAGSVLEVLKGFNVKVILHAFSGNVEEVRRALDSGYYLSIGPNVVYNQYRQMLASMVPLEGMVTETDSPVLGPDREGRNEPANVRIALENVARIKGIPQDEVKSKLLTNAGLFFKLP